MSKTIHCLFLLLCFGKLAAQIPSRGQVLWLKAGSGYMLDSLGNARIWKDASGYRNDARQIDNTKRPHYIKNSLNGFPALAFDGQTSTLSCPNKFPIGTGGYTIMLVMQMKSVSGAYNTMIGGNLTRLFWMEATDHPSLYQYPLSIATGSVVPQAPQFGSVGTVVNDSARTASIFQNGKISYTDFNDSVPNNDSGINIGSYAGYYWNFSGNIAEVLIYNRPLSFFEVDSINQYFNNKFKINQPANAEVVLEKFPQYLQLYQRDKYNSALVPISGYTAQVGFDSVILKVYKNDTFVNRKTKKLDYISGKARFAFNPKIHAELNEFSFELHLKNSSKDTIVAFQKNITCGDVFVISGQSNTVVGDYQSVSFSNEYCRSFGAPWSNSLCLGSDTFWGYASGFNIDAYDVGGWGFRLQKYIHDSIQIPVAFIDGGVSGTSIELNMKNPHFPLDLTTIYGRLLYRMQKAHVDSSVRALFWYQGESNSDANYYNNFKTLYKNWIHDYPSLEKVYVIQIHTGCYLGSHWRLREIQRNLIDSFKLVRTMSVMGTPGHDGCHYNNVGYDNIGLKMWRLVGRDFYHNKDSNHITAPDVDKVFYRTSAQNSIGILFKDRDTGLTWTSDTILGGDTFNISKSFYLDDSFGRVKKIFKHGDTLVLILDSARGYSGLTYLPDHYYQNTSSYYEGPWLMNSRQIGAFSFYNVPIIPYFKPKADFAYKFQCFGDSMKFIDSSTVSYKSILNYSWSFGDMFKSIVPSPRHLFNKDSIYKVTLIVTGVFNRKDSISKQVHVYPLPIAKFTYKVLNSTRVQFTPVDTTYTNYQWDFGDGSFSKRMKKIYIYAGSGKYVVSLTVQQNGCTNVYKDTVSVLSAGLNLVNNNQNEIAVYPNPFSNKVTIEMHPAQKGNIMIKLLDLTGIEVPIPVESNDQNEQRIFELKTDKLPSGIYFLQIMNGSNIFNRCIIKN